MLASAWDKRPEDLAALGYAYDAGELFGRIQRVATWKDGRPAFGRRGKTIALDYALPAIARSEASADGATKLLLQLHDGAAIEAVHMPRALSSERQRVTVCLSSQVGCAMGCTFCATAKLGLVRNLEAHEIVGQLLAVMNALGPPDASALNLVFMGMGEPLHNLDALLRALEILCDTAGLGVAPSRITVSTAGVVPGIDRLAQARFVPELAVSVNAATDEVRRSLMPLNKKWPLADLRAALDRWPRGRKITLEYVLLEGKNDDLASADRLATWIGDLRHVLNVIPFNEWQGSGFTRTSPDAFVARLRERGCLVKVRRSRGQDIRAACGTLHPQPG